MIDRPSRRNTKNKCNIQVSVRVQFSVSVHTGSVRVQFGARAVLLVCPCIGVEEHTYYLFLPTVHVHRTIVLD